jgi:glycerol-3-phosphate cytidylyltransferase
MIKLYTGGTFDLFHSGHVNFLRQCKNISNHVTVSLNNDDFIFKYKKRNPIFNYKERYEILSSCKYVDKVIENEGNEDSKPSILSINPNIIAIGTDWFEKDYYKQMNFSQQWLDERNITLVYIPYKQDISTSELLNKIKSF